MQNSTRITSWAAVKAGDAKRGVSGMFLALPWHRVSALGWEGSLEPLMAANLQPYLDSMLARKDYFLLESNLEYVFE